MNKNNKRLRGATLTELVVVLGVLAIISTIVISFLIMSNENVRTSSQKVDALNDIAVVENIMDNWLSSEMMYLPTDYIENNDKAKSLDLLINFDTGKTSQLKFDGTTLSSSIKGEVVTYQPQTIEKIETLIINKSESSKDRIAICYITYNLVLSDGTESKNIYSFVVYPYDGIPEVDYEQNN